MAKLPKAMNANQPRADITAALRAQTAAETSLGSKRANDGVPRQDPGPARLSDVKRD